MAVVKAGEDRQKRSGSLSFDAQGKRWVRAYTRTFKVQTDDPRDGVVTVLAAPGVPRFGDHYDLKNGSDFDLGAFVHNLSASVTSECGRQWEVVAEYGPWDPTRWPENPMDQPPEVSWESNRFEYPADVDTDGHAVVNSAGDPFDPPVMAEDSRPVLRITRNEAAYDQALTDKYRDTVNRAPWNDFDAGQARLVERSGQLQFHAQFGFYYKVSYRFEIAGEDQNDSWIKRVVDLGLRKLSGGVAVPVLRGGSPVTFPVLLNGAGGELAEGAEPVVLEFPIYSEEDFDALHLEVPVP